MGGPGSSAGVALVAGLLANRARAAMLESLLDGEAHPAGDLARQAGIAPSTASGHLAVLEEHGLVIAERIGRQRRYRLSGPRVGAAFETLAILAPDTPVVSLRQAGQRERLREARTCYDHLAGRLGVRITDALVADRSLRRSGPAFELTRRGGAVLERLGVDVDGARAGRRAFAIACLDWTERRHHLAGALGAELCTRAITAGWVRRRTGDRSVSLTDAGMRALASLGPAFTP